MLFKETINILPLDRTHPVGCHGQEEAVVQFRESREVYLDYLSPFLWCDPICDAEKKRVEGEFWEFYEQQ